MAVLLGLLGLNGSSSSTPTTTTSSSTDSSASKSSSSVTKMVAADSATVSDAARGLVNSGDSSGQTNSGQSSTYSSLGGAGSSSATGLSVAQQKAEQRASSKEAQYDDAVSTVGNVTRMNRAYANSSGSDGDTVLKNSFNRLFGKSAVTVAANTPKESASAGTTSSSDAKQESASA